MTLKLVRPDRHFADEFPFLSFLCLGGGEGVAVTHVNKGFSETMGALVEENLVNSALH